MSNTTDTVRETLHPTLVVTKFQKSPVGGGAPQKEERLGLCHSCFINPVVRRQNRQHLFNFDS